jgi:large subunit ribosomal protein L4
MAVIDVYNVKREKTSQIELREDVFGVPVNRHVLHQVVVSQLAGRRMGTASTKTRSEVSRSGKKLYRQKGTGRARSGPASSPTRRGGGVIFGPSPRSYVKKIPKRIRKAALKMALADKFLAERLVVLDEISLPDWKTKKFAQIMNVFDVRKALIVTEGKNKNLEISSKNLPWVKVMRVEGINVYDILNHEHLFLVQSTIPKIEEALVS